jgi:phospholipid/cholesterol/gamma-HCH transport system substrate-binding protein
MTADLSEVTSSRKEKVGEIIDQLHGITTALHEMVSDESGEGLKEAIQGAASSLGNIERAASNIEEITEKINRGDGTLGRLINDETTIEEINTAVSGVNDLLDTSSQLETSIDFHSNYLSASSLTKSFLGIRIQPGLDRYYELQLIDDPLGVSEESETTITNGNTSTTESRVVTQKNKVKFSALFAKSFHRFTVKGGLIENTGGMGLDYSLMRRRLQLSMEMFRFDDLQLRTSARYSFYPGIYVMAGGDDILDPVNQSAFLGAGIFLTNDDLKILMTSLSF